MAGDDCWITIVVRSDTEWQALCRVMQRDDLAADPALANVEGRREHADRLDKEIADWTLLGRGFSIMAELQAAGVPAGIVRSPAELGFDQHFMATGRWQIMERPYIGGHVQPVPVYVEGDATTGYQNRWPSPTVGQHNREVLQGELGLSDADFDALLIEGVIGFEARPKKPKAKG